VDIGSGILETISTDTSPSLISIGSYAQITFNDDLLPNYDDLQGIYIVSSNSATYELGGCIIQLLDANYEIVAQSDPLGDAANYFMRGPADITATYNTETIISNFNLHSINGLNAYVPTSLQVWEGTWYNSSFYGGATHEISVANRWYKDGSSFGALIVSSTSVSLQQDGIYDHLFSIANMTYDTRTVQIYYEWSGSGWTLTRQSWPTSINFVSSDVFYIDTNSNVGNLFTSPGDIVGWAYFSNYVEDVPLNEDSLARLRSQAFALTVGEDLVVNGDTTVNGNVGIGKGVSGHALDVSGDLNVDGTAYASVFTPTSDDRLKHNEQDISGLELITQLHPQKYLKTRMMYEENYTLTVDASGEYTNLKEGDHVHEEMGIIAQHVLDIPELSFCVTDSTPYALNYNNLFVLSIQAIKELKAEKDALQTSHDALKALLQSKGLLD
jgi:hypothetical protein